MLWQGKNIDALTDAELNSAIATVKETSNNYNNKRSQMQNSDRHKKMFASIQLPEINPLFTQLKMN